MRRSGKWSPTYLIQMSPIEMLLVARSCKSRTGGHHARLKYLLIEVRDDLDYCTGSCKRRSLGIQITDIMQILRRS